MDATAMIYIGHLDGDSCRIPPGQLSALTVAKGSTGLREDGAVVSQVRISARGYQHLFHFGMAMPGRPVQGSPADLVSRVRVSIRGDQRLRHLLRDPNGQPVVQLQHRGTAGASQTLIACSLVGQSICDQFAPGQVVAAGSQAVFRDAIPVPSPAPGPWDRVERAGGATRSHWSGHPAHAPRIHPSQGHGISAQTVCHGHPCGQRGRPALGAPWIVR